MAKKGAREIVGMVCSVCKNINYTTVRNKVNMQTKGSSATGKLVLKKYCKFCRKQTEHKETAKLK